MVVVPWAQQVYVLVGYGGGSDLIFLLNMLKSCCFLLLPSRYLVSCDRLRRSLKLDCLKSLRLESRVYVGVCYLLMRVVHYHCLRRVYLRMLPGIHVLLVLHIVMLHGCLLRCHMLGRCRLLRSGLLGCCLLGCRMLGGLLSGCLLVRVLSCLYFPGALCCFDSCLPRPFSEQRSIGVGMA